MSKCIMYFEMHAGEIQLFFEIKTSFFFTSRYISKCAYVNGLFRQLYSNLKAIFEYDGNHSFSVNYRFAFMFYVLKTLPSCTHYIKNILMTIRLLPQYYALVFTSIRYKYVFVTNFFLKISSNLSCEVPYPEHKNCYHKFDD